MLTISLAASAASVFLYMTLWFVVSLAKKRNDIADVAWGLGFIVVAFTTLLVNGGSSAQGILIITLVTIWGVRLAFHIARRNRHKGEDPRYKAWREAWGRHFYLRSFLQIYMFQGFLMLVISLPVVYAIHTADRPIGTFTVAGTAVWLLGFLFEAIADYQLAQFKKDPSHRGRVMQTGLWRYSRHPNYFGEVVLWWGIYLVALQSPGAWWTVIGPLTITVLILFVSGIPLLEKRYEGNPEFSDYARRTSVFLPLPPKET